MNLTYEEIKEAFKEKRKFIVLYELYPEEIIKYYDEIYAPKYAINALRGITELVPPLIANDGTNLFFKLVVFEAPGNTNYHLKMKTPIQDILASCMEIYRNLGFHLHVAPLPCYSFLYLTEDTAQYIVRNSVEIIQKITDNPPTHAFIRQANAKLKPTYTLINYSKAPKFYEIDWKQQIENTLAFHAQKLLLS